MSTTNIHPFNLDIRDIDPGEVYYAIASKENGGRCDDRGIQGMVGDERRYLRTSPPRIGCREVVAQMTSHSDLFDTFERTLGNRMEKIFEQSMLGGVFWDPEKWAAFLDWIQGPLRKRLYTKWLEENPDQAPENHPAYAAFESFDRARMQGVLEKGALVSVCFTAVKEGMSLEQAGLNFFGVKFIPPPSEFEKNVESRGP